jgi:large subunit ribosomal protein L25
MFTLFINQRESILIMSKIIKLDGNPRSDFGSAKARRLRKANRIPAVISNSKDNIFLDIDLKSFENEYIKGGITTKIFEISLDTRIFKVLCRQVDINPVSDRPRHVDFFDLADRKEVKVLVPLKFLNIDKAPGLKKSGHFLVLKREVLLICDTNSIPSQLEVNCENVKLKQFVKLSTVKLPEKTRSASNQDIQLARIIGRGREEDADIAKAAVTPTIAVSTSTPATASTTTTAISKKNLSSPLKN